MTDISNGDTSPPDAYAAGRLRHVPNTPPARNRVFRCPDELYFAAQAKAKERGENLSAVLRQSLERYVRLVPRASDVARNQAQVPPAE
jgi:hypothetical protein